jgi:hypothetical protein
MTCATQPASDERCPSTPDQAATIEPRSVPRRHTSALLTILRSRAAGRLTPSAPTCGTTCRLCDDVGDCLGIC